MPTQDKIIQMLSTEYDYGYTDRPMRSYTLYGLSQSGRLFELVDHEWKLSAHSPNLEDH